MTERVEPVIMEGGLLVARQSPENPDVVELFLDGKPALTLSVDNLDALASFRARMGPRETNDRSEFTEREANALRMWYDQVKENRRLVHALIEQTRPGLDSNQLRSVFRHYAGGNISLGKAIETVNEWLAGAEVGKLPAHELLNEPVFVLRAQDVAAPHAVDAWCALAELAGADQFTLHGARVIAEQMRLWQETHFERVKVPDREPDVEDSPSCAECGAPLRDEGVSTPKGAVCVGCIPDPGDSVPEHVGQPSLLDDLDHMGNDPGNDPDGVEDDRRDAQYPPEPPDPEEAEELQPDRTDGDENA